MQFAVFLSVIADAEHGNGFSRKVLGLMGYLLASFGCFEGQGILWVASADFTSAVLVSPPGSAGGRKQKTEILSWEVSRSRSTGSCVALWFSWCSRTEN